MPTLYNRKTQQWETVAPEQVTEAVASGTHALAAGGRVRVALADGQTGTIPAEEAETAFRSGAARFETLGEAQFEQAKRGSSAAATFAAGAVDAATMGLASQLATSADRTGRASLALRAGQEAHPVAWGAGVLAGSLAPGSITGAAAKGAGGAVAKALAKKGTESLTRTVLRTAAAGAAEGAVFGAQGLVSENAVGRADFNATSVISHVGLGAVIGGGAGAVFGGAGPAIRKAAESMGGTKIADAIKNIGDEYAIRTVVGKQKGAFKKLAGKGLTEDAARFIRDDLGLKLGDSVEAMAPRIEAKTAELAQRLHGMVAMLDEAAVKAGRPAMTGEAVAQKIREVAGKKFAGQALSGERGWLMGEADAIEKLGTMSFVDAVAERRAAQAAARYNALEPQGAALAKRLKATAWNDAIDESAEPLLSSAGLDGAAYKALRRKEWVGFELQKFSQDRVVGNQNINFLSPMEYGLLGGATVMGDPISGVGMALARKGWRKYGDAAAALALNKVSNLTKIQAAANTTQTAIARVASKLGRLGAVAPGRDLAAIGVLQTSLLTGKRADATTVEAAKARSEELSQLMADPQQLADRIAAHTAGGESDAPETSRELAAQAARAVEFLAAKAPKRPPTNGLQPDAGDWDLDEDSAVRFGRYYAAAMDPLTGLDDLEAGALTEETVETWRALYPPLLELLQVAVQAKAAQTKDPLPYEDLVQLSLLFGTPLHPSMEPQAIADAQKIYQTQQPEQGRGPGGTRLTGINKDTKFGERAMTTSQRLQERS